MFTCLGIDVPVHSPPGTFLASPISLFFSNHLFTVDKEKGNFDKMSIPTGFYNPIQQFYLFPANKLEDINLLSPDKGTAV